MGAVTPLDVHLRRRRRVGHDGNAVDATSDSTIKCTTQFDDAMPVKVAASLEKTRRSIRVQSKSIRQVFSCSELVNCLQNRYSISHRAPTPPPCRTLLIQQLERSFTSRGWELLSEGLRDKTASTCSPRPQPNPGLDPSARCSGFRMRYQPSLGRRRCRTVVGRGPH